MTGIKLNFRIDFHGRQFFTRFLFSIVLLAVILVFAVASVSLNIAALERSGRTAVSYIQMSLQNFFGRINEVKAKILIDSDFESIRNTQGSTDFTNIYLHQCSVSLRHIEQTDSLIKKLFIFSHDLNWFIGSENWGNIDNLVQSLSCEVDESSGLSSLFTERIYDVLITDISAGNVLILMPLNYAKSQNPYNLCIGVVADRAKLLPSDIDKYQNIVIYSERNKKVVYDMSGLFNAGVNYAELDNLENGQTVQRGNIIVSAGKNTVLGLKCIILTDKSGYFRSYYLLICLVFLLLACSLIVAVAVSSMRKQNRHMSDVITRQNKVLAENVICRLLDGSVSETDETLHSLGVDFVSNLFCVVIANCTCDTKTAIERIKASAAAVMFHANGFDAFLVNILQNDEYSDKYVIECIKNDDSFTEASVSSVHCGLNSVRDCYIEALCTMEYQKSHGIDFMSYSMLEANTRKNSFHFPLDVNLSIHSAIREGNSTRANDLIMSLVEENRQSGVSPRVLRYLLISITGTVIRAVNSLDRNVAQAVPQPDFSPALVPEDFGSSLAGIKEIVDSVCFSIENVRAGISCTNKASYLLYTRMVDYIHENYFNQMMNVSSVAGAFNVSVAYASKIFSEYNGTNMLDYITKFRIERAKEFMADGRNIGDTALLCGFGSLRTFLRVFKLREGVTPGQYRSSVTEEENNA